MITILLKGNLLKMKEIRSTEDGNSDPCSTTCKDMTRCTWYTTETVINSETKAESYRCLYFSDCTLSLETNSIHEEVSIQISLIVISVVKYLSKCSNTAIRSWNHIFYL